MRVYSQAPPLGTPVCPPRGYSNTQQMHARHKTRARFGPNSLEAKHVNTYVKSRYTCRCHPHPKAAFHRTRNKCKREYVLLEPELHDIAIRKIRFGLPKSGNTKVVSRKRFIDMIFLCQYS